MSTTIPLAEPLLPAACADAVANVVSSTFVGPGQRTRTFEESMADVVCAEDAVATASGTVALGIAARAIGLVPGDEVVVPAYGVISVANGFAAEGFAVRPVEVDRATAMIDPAALDAELASSPAVRAVCMVDFSGYVGPVTRAVLDVAHEHGVPVIEDAACALGSTCDGLVAGSIGDVATTSFSVPKVVTTGQGGAVLGRREVIDRARAWIDQGDLEWRSSGINRAVGTNLRFTDLQAAVGQVQIDDLPGRLARRMSVHQALRRALGDALWTIPGAAPPLHNIVFSDDPDGLVSALRGEGVLAARQYSTLTRHPAYADVARGPFPASDWWSGKAVYLPFGTALDLADAKRIADAVRAAHIPLIAHPSAMAG